MEIWKSLKGLFNPHPENGEIVRLDRCGITGKVTFEVFGPDGKLKQRSVTHNLVVDEGDALIADALANTPAKTKVNEANGYIAVGISGSTAGKGDTWIRWITGSPEVMDTGYPQTKGSYGAANDNVVVYKSTFEAGDLNATGINEAILANGTTSGGAEIMAYAQMTSVDVTASDTLAVTWEMTVLRA
jgi:hypothetical protein